MNKRLECHVSILHSIMLGIDKRHYGSGSLKITNLGIVACACTTLSKRLWGELKSG